jgi:AcrR family transcriptional regulator
MSEPISDRLIAVAGPAFARRGFEGVSIRDICRDAGTSVAAVNYHFGDKQSLYAACLETAQAECNHRTLAAVDPQAPPHERLRGFIAGMLAGQLAPEKPAWHMELMLREMVHPTEATRLVVERFIQPLSAKLREILDEICPGISASEHEGWPTGFSIVAQVLFYGTYAPITRLLMGDESFQRLSVDAIADHVTRFSLAALGKAQPLGFEGPRALGSRTP